MANEAKKGALARPDALYALFRDVATLPGVGPDMAKRLPKLLGVEAPTLWDLLARLPRKALDMSALSSLQDMADGAVVTIEAVPIEHLPPSAPRRPYRIRAEGPGELVDLVFFRAYEKSLRERFALGRPLLLRGKLSRFDGVAQITHPQVATPEEAEAGAAPQYALAAGVRQERLEKIIGAALELAPDLPEWLDASLVAAQGWPTWREALILGHRPDEAAGDLAAHRGRRRLAFDELFASQLTLALHRGARGRKDGRAWPPAGALRARFLASLPFAPTAAQEKALQEIDVDLDRPAPMTRLLQGDVGSGKTLVALLAMLRAVEAGAQTALMAPTDVLARQHARSLERFLAPIGLAPTLLLGRDGAAAKRAALEAIASGAAQVVVGTHALFQDQVVFRDLGFAVVDEQHRFGVHQRLDLKRKGRAVDLLATTATPIPRTVVMCCYGDVAVSELRERPPGRKPVKTIAASIERLAEIEAACARAIAKGERVFWVCPSIDGDEAQLEEDAVAGPASAEARFEALSARFPGLVGLAHGRLRPDAKAASMADFAEGRTQLLVATTVIEVGVDVPEASVMVIEDAARFGLAALHQLRGRVGRGAAASTCVLLFRTPLSASARTRIETLRRTDDGFELAETDLALRGPGEILGAKQSGAPTFRFADLALDADLLPLARDAAALTLARAGREGLAGDDGLRLLFHLFGRGDALALIG